VSAGAVEREAAERADWRLLDQFYRGVDTNLKLVGAARMGASNVWVRLSRYSVHSNLLEPELRAILAQITDLRSWYPAWAERAAHFERLGEQAREEGHGASAAEYLLTASALYHFAQINTRPESPLKAEGGRRSAECYRRAAEYFHPVAVRFELPWEGTNLPGYLRAPRPPFLIAPGLPPVVILINGANCAKEELHAWTDPLLRRGLATVVFDGPGQGELAVRQGGVGLTADGYDRAVQTVLDWLPTQLVDGRRVGLWGMSMGGLCAARVAARDERVRAAVSIGGLYSLERYGELPVPTQEEMRDLTGLATLAETKAYLTAAYGLDGPGEIRCPFLVVHGALDDIVSTEEAERLAAAAGDRGELCVFEDGLHVCYNLFQELRPRIADWLVDHLTGRVP
jgi:dipeptidyl aminopeptidase/acylaminoacyl peptidase